MTPDSLRSLGSARYVQASNALCFVLLKKVGTSKVKAPDYIVSTIAHIYPVNKILLVCLINSL